MSEVSVFCHICNGIAVARCRLCGRFACDRHFDAKLGICTSCKHGRQ